MHAVITKLYVISAELDVICLWNNIIMVKRVLIIGAGGSGITAVKQVRDEGLEPVCVEGTNDIGGLWYFTEQVRDGQATVMRSTIINTSKEVRCFR